MTALALVGLAPGVAQAQSQYDVFGSGALAIAAYEASKEQCIYSDKLGKALTDIDAFLGRQDAYRWQESKRLGPDSLRLARNMARIQGASDCKVYGLAIGNAAIVYFNAAEFDQAVFAEFNQLLKGDGRSISGEAEARPPQPPAPGSAADTIAKLNGGRGIDNTPAAQPPQSSTLKRLPADDPPPTSSRSQPPPRQSAEPSPRLGDRRLASYRRCHRARNLPVEHVPADARRLRATETGACVGMGALPVVNRQGRRE